MIDQSCVPPAKMKDPDFTRHERNHGCHSIAPMQYFMGMISRVRIESRKRFIRNAVDKIEDARSREFNKAQQGSTRRPHLIEIEAIENRALSREAGIRLGHRQSRVCFQRLTGRSPVQRTGGRPQS
jgi:hypothetical protein